VRQPVPIGRGQFDSLYEGAFFNGTEEPASFNYMTPDVPIVINGRADATSQRFHVRIGLVFISRRVLIFIFPQDTCELTFNVTMPETPPIDLKFVFLPLSKSHWDLIV
jgi:hypothetical protein